MRGKGIDSQPFLLRLSICLYVCLIVHFICEQGYGDQFDRVFFAPFLSLPICLCPITLPCVCLSQSFHLPISLPCVCLSQSAHVLIILLCVCLVPVRLFLFFFVFLFLFLFLFFFCRIIVYQVDQLIYNSVSV